MIFMSANRSGDIVLHVHIQPQATKSKIVGIYDDCLKIAVKAPPVEGKANRELLRFLASILGVKKRQLEIKSGAMTRRKQVPLLSVDPADISDKLNSCMTSEI